MSSEGRVAKLYAEVGFEVSDAEAEKVKQVFNSIKEKIDEAIEKTAQFASDLVKLSKGTGLSSTVLQNFHKMGIEAGITADEVDGLLQSTNELANKSYWGFTNQLSMWGIYLSRGETAASALIKVLRGMNGQSYNRQLEIAREAGIDITAALLMLDRFKENGFKLEDAFGLDEKTVQEMHQVNVEFNKLDYSWDMFYHRLVGTQSDTILRTTKGISGFIQRIQDAIVGIASTTPMRGILGTALTLMPLVNYALNYADKVLKGFDTAFRIMKNAFGVAKWGLFLAIALKVLGIFHLIKDIDIFGGIQKQFDKFIKGSGGLGKEIVEKMDAAIEGALSFVNENIPDLGKKIGLTEFLQDAKGGKIFEALGKWIDRLIVKATAWWRRVYGDIKEWGRYFLDSALATLKAAWNWVSDQIYSKWLMFLYKFFKGAEEAVKGVPFLGRMSPFFRKKAGEVQAEMLGFNPVGWEETYNEEMGTVIPPMTQGRKDQLIGAAKAASGKVVEYTEDFLKAMGKIKDKAAQAFGPEDPKVIDEVKKGLGEHDKLMQSFINWCETSGLECPNPSENLGAMLQQGGNTSNFNNNVNISFPNVTQPYEAARRTAGVLQDPSTWTQQNVEFNACFGGRNSNGFQP